MCFLFGYVLFFAGLFDVVLFCDFLVGCCLLLFYFLYSLGRGIEKCTLVFVGFLVLMCSRFVASFRFLFGM